TPADQAQKRGQLERRLKQLDAFMTIELTPPSITYESGTLHVYLGSGMSRYSRFPVTPAATRLPTFRTPTLWSWVTWDGKRRFRTLLMRLSSTGSSRLTRCWRGTPLPGSYPGTGRSVMLATSANFAIISMNCGTGSREPSTAG